jgi:hypothetical protein
VVHVKYPFAGDGCLAVPLNAAELPGGENLRGHRGTQMQMVEKALRRDLTVQSAERDPILADDGSGRRPFMAVLLRFRCQRFGIRSLVAIGQATACTRILSLE